MKAVDFTHIVSRGGLYYCPKCDKQMERMEV